MNQFEPNKLLSYNEISIIEEIQRVYFKFFGSRHMSKKEFNLHSRVSDSTVVRHFGSWEKALEQANIPISTRTRKPKHDYAEIKSDLIRIKEFNQGKYFTYAFYKESGGKYYKKISKQLGYQSWEELLNKELDLYKSVNVIVLKKENKFFSEAQLLNEIKIVWDKVGRRPTYREFKENSSIGISVFETRFKGWTNAIEQFCLINEKYDSYNAGMKLRTSKELLLKELKIIKGIHQTEVLKFVEYKEHGGKYTKDTFIKYFGSWKNAIQLVGLKPASEWNKSPEKHLLFDEIQRIWEALGRQPLYKEWNGLSKYKNVLYDRKFGGWNKAVHAFIADRENLDEEIVANQPQAKNELPINDVVKTPNLASSNLVETIVMTTARGVPPKLRFRVFMRDNFTCQYCKRTKEDDGVKLQADHIIAYSNGGETVFENLITACWDCNIGKSNMVL